METENKNTNMSKNSWIWTVVVLVVLVVLVLWVRHMSDSTATVDTQNTGINPTDQTALTPVST